MKKQLSLVEKGKILAWKKLKKSNRWIGKQLKRAEGTIRYFYKNYKLTSATNRKFGSGSRRKTSIRQDNMIKRLALTTRSISRQQIIQNLQLPISKTTMSRRLKEKGLRGRVAAKKPFISRENIKKRLKWARDHKNWTQDQWKKVLWSDEAPFVLYWSGKKVVWRRKNERYLPECTTGTIKNQTKKLMLWGCFAANGIGNLHRIYGIMNANIYKNILIYKMKPSAKKLFPNGNYIFQHDNDSKHTANLVKNYIKKSKIQLLDWPPQSPDLNPIENLWKILKDRTKNKKHKNLDDLFKNLQETWMNLEVQLLETLANSMQSRCTQVIQNKGYPIKY